MNCILPGLTSFTTWIVERVHFHERVSALVDLLRIRCAPDGNIFDECDEDFFGPNRGGSKFIERYSIDDLTSIISESRNGDQLRNRGIDDWYLEFDLHDCFLHYCYVRRRCLPDREKFIGFLIVQLGNFQIRQGQNENRGVWIMQRKLPETLNLLNIRWLSLQDPQAEFSEQRPRLTSQRFPGTGFGKDVYETILMLETREERDGIVNVPEHFHNAFMYKKLRFLNPECEAIFQKIQEDLAVDLRERGLAAMSWAIYLGFLRCDEHKTAWEPQEQIFAISRRMKTYFKSRDYQVAIDEKKHEIGHFAIE
jgi:hypothetical protein